MSFESPCVCVYVHDL